MDDLETQKITGNILKLVPEAREPRVISNFIPAGMHHHSTEHLIDWPQVYTPENLDNIDSYVHNITIPAYVQCSQCFVYAYSLISKSIIG